MEMRAGKICCRAGKICCGGNLCSPGEGGGGVKFPLPPWVCVDIFLIRM